MYGRRVLERAFELARTGEFTSRSKIGKAMEKEGFTIIEVAELTGASITRELNRICRTAKAGAA